MENTDFGSSRLKSQTVKYLARLFSLFKDDFNSNVPEKHELGIHCNASERTRKEEAHNETSSPKNDMQTCKSTESSSIQVEISNPQLQLLNELEHLQEEKENEDLCLNPSMLLVEANSTVVDGALPTKNQSGHNDLDQKSVEDSVQESQEMRGKGLLECKASTFGLVEDPGVKEQIVIEEVDQDMKPTCKETGVDSSTSLVKNKESEEGEILDDLGVGYQLHDLILEDPVEFDEGRLEEVRIRGDPTKQGEISDTYMAQKGMNGQDTVVSASLAGIVMDNCFHKELKGKGTVKESTEAEGTYKWSVVCYDDLGHPGKPHEKVVAKNQGKTSSVKVDKVDVKRKCKMAAEEKKKMKKKRKRAEKDKQSGVKRLRLQPISKPKTVTYCDFFLKGRCQQGDLCKFSHDTTPLTKSQPCRYFIQQSCLKGDDCPFDHQLSKYPCDNFRTKGFCIRGDKCLFSHKMESSSSTSIAGTVSVTSIPLQSANSGRQPNKGNTSYQTTNISKNIPTHSYTPTLSSSLQTSNSKPKGQNVAEVKFTPPAQAPKGISFLSFRKVESDDSSKQHQGDMPLPPTRDNVGADIGCWKKQGVSEKFLDPNVMPWRKPASPHSLCQPPKMMGDGKTKDMRNSAQKALSSTLAFASKYESAMKGQSIKSPALAVEPDKGPKSSISSSSGSSFITVTDILQEFLSGSGGAGDGGNSKKSGNNNS